MFLLQVLEEAMHLDLHVGCGLRLDVVVEEVAEERVLALAPHYDVQTYLQNGVFGFHLLRPFRL